MCIHVSLVPLLWKTLTNKLEYYSRCLTSLPLLPGLTSLPKHTLCVCICSVTKLCLTLCLPTDCSMPGFPVLHYLWSLLKLMSTESMMLSNHLIFCCPFLFLPSIFPSIRVFSNKSAFCIRWPQY